MIAPVSCALKRHRSSRFQTGAHRIYLLVSLHTWPDQLGALAPDRRFYRPTAQHQSSRKHLIYDDQSGSVPLTIQSAVLPATPPVLSWYWALTPKIRHHPYGIIGPVYASPLACAVPLPAVINRRRHGRDCH